MKIKIRKQYIICVYAVYAVSLMSSSKNGYGAESEREKQLRARLRRRLYSSGMNVRCLESEWREDTHGMEIEMWT